MQKAKLKYYIRKSIWIFFVYCHQVFAQNTPKTDINLQEFVQNLLVSPTNDLPYEQIFENLYSFYQNPIDINRADAEQLRALNLLSEIQINAIVNHRQKFGALVSLYELQAIEGLDVGTIKNIMPFLKITLAYDLQNLKSKIDDHYLIFRTSQTFQKSAGFENDKYLGSRQSYYTRYRLSNRKDFSVGFVSEKDPGEKHFFDYANFHVQVQNKRALKNLVLGNYRLQFGQGLIFAGGYLPGKGSEAIYTTRRSNLGILPYNSLVENGSFKGIASTIEHKNWQYTTMFSFTKKDASVVSDSVDFFTALLQTGLHRTNTEIEKKNRINEQNIGANITYKLPNIQIGLSAINTKFDVPYLKRDVPYNRYEFVGNGNTLIGSNVSILWQNFNFFGEAGRSSSGGMGFVGGLEISYIQSPFGFRT